MVKRLVPLDMCQENEPEPFAFSTQWQVLGPFQIGTREGPWGADPLAYVGGFGNLRYDSEANFRSSLPANGTAQWSIVEPASSAASSTSANVSLSIGFDTVDWDFLKVVYGWAAVQYQVWTRGEVLVRGDKSQTVILYTDAVMEYWIDGVQYFGGDMYSIRRAPPVLHLAPGSHRVDLRLWRDVRAFGGINKPTIDVIIEVQKTSRPLELATPGILMSDVVDGRLASPIGSVTLRNSGEDDIEVVDIQSSDVRCPISLLKQTLQVACSTPTLSLTLTQSNIITTEVASRLVLVAGQTRPVAFHISLPGHNTTSVQLTIIHQFVKSRGQLYTLNVSQHLTKTSVYNSHKITYLHPGGIASYAMLHPPAKNSTGQTEQNVSLPVLIANHGAGLEADNPLVAHALDSVSDLRAWVLYPTGVTPWSSDDWHNWGFADVEAAVNSIPSWIKHVRWQGPKVDVNRWIMTGHSNGGQGTWYGLTHRPDKLIAAAPISGYASIQTYVPYHLWQPADPRRTAIISASLNSHRHEMLLENAKGIPVLQQHGEIDDNVPTYNSRLLSQALYQTGTNSSYHEIPSKNHWWDGVMITEPMVNFYHEQMASRVKIPRKLDSFSIVIGDPGDTGPKGGIRVLNLEDPGQYGRVEVNGHDIKTFNVQRLELDPTAMKVTEVIIDGIEMSLNSGRSTRVAKTARAWQMDALETVGGDVLYRSGRQLGSIMAILRTHGPFIIRHEGIDAASIALQVSRNLHQYFYADSKIETVSASDDSETGNVVSVAIGGDVPPSLHPNFPIQAGPFGISVRDRKGSIRKYNDGSRLSAVFLRPLLNERLELVIWGSDSLGLAQAARLVPTVTGVGQPDFVVLSEAARWRGVEGALSLGFLDHMWEVTSSSVVS